MGFAPTDPLLVAGLLAGVLGLLLFAQASLQHRMLRRRLATGVGTAIFDPPTGLFAAEATMQCIRGEANRAARLARPLDVWLGDAADSELADRAGRELTLLLPPGAIGLRLDATRLCITSCADLGELGDVAPELDWQHRRIPAGDHAATAALAFVAAAPEATDG